ncbi:hypothetical protein BCV69DRAFT_285122 [Microstroma glucosiphilum]|uniref:DASH complex subunit DAD4 n=1 Tax=Pseudomicrostroma glucosiphilum TaxID=1684307 RepID=A0A316TZ83_9BASI|nr:hypothetical protein BCV69DRAFT_285122 [Pseudomicrostroma glucosiphilum]PWN18492.1 hypothetical protein BCV69DRAFT_285122 [Pseudomicrostroma glucosiphilum]
MMHIENPHEQRQTLLLSRIIKNVDLLNESLEELGRSLAEINVYNEGNAEVADMWENYRRNAAFNLEDLETSSPSTGNQTQQTSNEGQTTQGRS